MPTRRQRAFAMFVALATCTSLHAGDGTLDAGYGEGGAVLLSGHADELVDVLHAYSRSDRSAGRESSAIGRIFSPIGTQDLVLARVDDRGQPDLSFGPDGARRIATALTRVEAATHDALGRLLVAGAAPNPIGAGQFVALQRYSAGGELDAQFGTGGIAYLAFDTGVAAADTTFDSARQVIAADDGSILVAATLATPQGDTDIGVARLTAAGDPDASFGGDGRVQLDFGPPASSTSQDEPGALSVLADGGVLVAGTSTIAQPGNSSRSIVLAKLRPDGAPDPAFCSEADRQSGACRTDVSRQLPPGLRTIETDSGLPQRIDEAHALLARPDGGFIVGGATFALDATRLTACALLAWFDADGRERVLPRADAHGMHCLQQPVEDHDHALVVRALLPSGDGVIAAGSYERRRIDAFDAVHALAAFRVHDEGVIDTGFGSDAARPRSGGPRAIDTSWTLVQHPVGDEQLRGAFATPRGTMLFGGGGPALRRMLLAHLASPQLFADGFERVR